jgi:hypothetical protein
MVFKRTKEWVYKHPLARTALALLAFAVAITVFILIWVLWQPTSQSVNAPAAIRLDFGYSRTPLTRMTSLPLCRGKQDNQWPSKLYPECPEFTGQGKGARPQIDSALLAGDLNPATGAVDETKSCVGGSSGPQFPAGQVTVSAANIGTSDLSLTLTADPAKSEGVPPGNYCGRVVIRRALGGPVELAVSMRLADKTQLQIVYRAFFALALGAILGWLIKWVTDSFSVLGTALNRYQRFIRDIPGGTKNLPTNVREALADILNSISYAGTADVANLVKKLDDFDSHRDDLLGFAQDIGHMREQVQQQHIQRAAIPWVDNEVPNLKTAQVQEAQEMKSWLNTEWPSAAPQAAATERTRKLQDVDALTAKLSAARNVPADQVSTSQVVNDLRDAADALLTKGTVTQGQPTVLLTVEDAARPRATSMLQWWLGHRLLLFGSIIGFVIALVGLQTQFLGKSTFSDSFIDYFTLGVWAFASQVAGTSLAEMAGKIAQR